MPDAHHGLPHVVPYTPGLVLPITDLAQGDPWPDGVWCVKHGLHRSHYRLSVSCLSASVYVYLKVLRRPVGVVSWDTSYLRCWDVGTPVQPMIQELYANLIAQAHASLEELKNWLTPTPKLAGG